ncbi:MAG: RluA family pseudouridine synthase [Gammaproteobacteria bacterium]|nr:RluA family pseudouridine synthase [Gammaproteobacteria bacterium]
MPNARILECTVPEELHDSRADVILAKQFPEYSRNQWIQWLREGRATVNEQTLIPKNKLQAHQIIQVKIPELIINTEAQAQDIPLDIIYEDEEILILDKPTGLVVHPGAGQSDNTLMNALLFHDAKLEQLPRAGIVHRLDKETTGLMVVAKTSVAHQALVHAMQEREIRRYYYALVHGVISASGKISTFYGRHPQNRLKMAVRPMGKTAVTHYKVVERFSQNTFVDVQLETGRTHQIRVHMQHLGYPLVGDPLYGKARAPGKGPVSDALNAFPRQALHAYQLELLHPTSQKPLTFSSQIPDDFAYLLEILRNH